MDTNFLDLCLQLEHRLRRPLPGPQAHNLFRAKPVGNMRLLLNHKRPPRPSGVLILLYEEEGRVRFPLIKRADYVGAHGGQISLPGGKAETGENVVETALRECEEEIGVNREAVHVLGKLSDFLVTPSNFLVTPVVGYVTSPPVFVPDPYEVAGIIEAQLAHLVDDEYLKEKEIVAAGKYRMRAPHFELENEVVWGATAMMLSELRVVLKELE